MITESKEQLKCNKTEISDTMRAAVLEKSGHFALSRIPIRQPSSNEVLICVEGCGVCGSNLSLWNGKPWFSYPLAAGAPGHEGWGYIQAIGSEVNNVHPGQRVTFLSGSSFAQYETVAHQNVIPLPESLNQLPFPGEPLGCVINIFERCQISSGQLVGIIGTGFIGTLLTSLCSQSGATVVAFSRRDCSLQFSRQYGAKYTYNINNQFTLIDKLDKDIGTHEFDCIIEVTGYQESIDFINPFLKNRGRLVIAGYHQDGPRCINMQLWNWHGIDVINAHERDPLKYITGIKKAVEMVVSGSLDIKPLFTHYFTLDTINQAFTTLTERPDGFMKALVLL